MATAARRDATVEIRGLDHDFGAGDNRKRVLHSIDLRLGQGEIVILTGPSGSGKTTLLTLIGALRSVQSGSVVVLGQELRGLSARELVAVRRRLGFIFQAHNLFDSLTARQNVRMALELQPGLGNGDGDLDRRAGAMLERVGLAHRLDYKPQSLSGGQRQRVAVARALAATPRLVLADEPTAALDKDSGRAVVELLQQLASEHGTSTILVTHDNRILDVADRIVNMVDGRIASDVVVGRSLEICEFLARTKVFAGLTPGALPEIAEQMATELVAARTVIFRQGDPGDKFCLIRSGSVDIVVDRDGVEEVVAVRGPGDVFGEVSLLSDQPRNATVVAREDVELYTLSKEHFRAALARSKSVREQLLELLSTRR
jgi:putative ABC transport system ATP-binding protein